MNVSADLFLYSFQFLMNVLVSKYALCNEQIFFMLWILTKNFCSLNQFAYTNLLYEELV